MLGVFIAPGHLAQIFCRGENAPRPGARAAPTQFAIAVFFGKFVAFGFLTQVFCGGENASRPGMWATPKLFAVTVILSALGAPRFLAERNHPCAPATAFSKIAGRPLYTTRRILNGRGGKARAMADIVLVSAAAVSPSLDEFLALLFGEPVPSAVLHGVGYCGSQGIDVYDLRGEVRLNVVRPGILTPHRLYSRAAAMVGFLEPGEPLAPLAERMDAVWKHRTIPGAVVTVVPEIAAAPINAAATVVATPEDAQDLLTNLLAGAL